MNSKKSSVFRVIKSRYLQHDIKEPRIIKTYKKLKSEKSSADGYLILVMGYARSPYRDFESYLRIFVVLDEKIFN